MTDKILVLTTASSKDEARKIGRALVESLLAACVNIVPQVGAIYRWEGEVEEAKSGCSLSRPPAARLNGCGMQSMSFILMMCPSASAYPSRAEAWSTCTGWESR